MKNIPFVFLLLLSISVSGQDYQLPLWENEIPNFQKTTEKEIHDTSRGILWISKVQTPSIDVYLPTPRNATGQAVIICPGGGYHGLAYDWEGTDVARWLNSKGIAGIVLKYRLPTSKSQIIPKDSPLLDAKRGMRLVRHHAKDWNIDTDKIGIMGLKQRLTQSTKFLAVLIL